MTEMLQTENTQEITSFEDLHLDRKILAALKEMGFEEPSPIQKGAIPGKLPPSGSPSSRRSMKKTGISKPWS